jgi:hypothetical protein
MKTKPMTINIGIEKIKKIEEAKQLLGISRSKLVSMLLEESLLKLHNYLNKETRNFYILQYIRGNITEEVLFDVFPREKASEIIDGVKFGRIGARRTLEMLSSV